MTNADNARCAPGTVPRLAAAALLCLLWIAAARPAAAQVCTAIDSSAIYLGDRIGVELVGPLHRRVLEEALDEWRRCANYGTGFPAFGDGPGDRSVTVRYRPGAVGRGHCGSFERSEIVLYDQMIDDQGRRVGCGSLALNLAHELGHVLGLADAPTDGGCERTVMSWITPRNAFKRGVASAECQAAGQAWLTRSELASVRGKGATFASFTVGSSR